MTEHTTWIFSRFVVACDSLSLSFMSLNKADVKLIVVLRASTKFTCRLTHFLFKYERHPGPLKYYSPIIGQNDVGFIIIKLAMLHLTADLAICTGSSLVCHVCWVLQYIAPWVGKIVVI